MMDHPNYNMNNWRWAHHGPRRDNVTRAALSAIKCPFEVTLETTNDKIPGYICDNVVFLQTGEQGAPITGYYGSIPGIVGASAKVLLMNYYGIWFEAQLQDRKFIAIRVARPVLRVTQDPLDGITMTGIVASGVPVASSQHPSRAPSRAASRADFHDAIDPDVIHSSQMTRGQPPFPPRGGP